MRIGLFGGTFDPIHVGHLILAEQAREQAWLDQVWFVPAPRPPQKSESALTRYEQRVEMLHIATAGHASFRVEEAEKGRAGPSFTVDTVAQLQANHPGDEFHLLVGSDTLADLEHWHEPVRLVSLVPLVVMARPGTEVLSAEVLRERIQSGPIRLMRVDSPLITIASRDLRTRVASGRSIRYFVPRPVEVYIAEKGLYRISEPRTEAALRLQ